MLPLPLERLLVRRTHGRLLDSVQRAWIWLIARHFRPTHVYVSHPKLFVLLPAEVKERTMIVYDCMDDAVAMAAPSSRLVILDYERELIEAAERVIVSSSALMSRLESRFGDAVTAKARLVQNGVHLPATGLAQGRRVSGKRHPVTVGYAGTVAAWFDFESVLRALDACPDVRMRIIGPRTGSEPTHDCIDYREAVSHEELRAHLVDCDALIMPFKRDEIVTAVNPVKLYEYLTYGVPIIATRYEEIEDEFGAFIEMYDTQSELTELFCKLIDGQLTSRGEPSAIERFVEASTWTERWQAVERASDRSVLIT